jgi:hypothetical protein
MIFCQPLPLKRAAISGGPIIAGLPFSKMSYGSVDSLGAWSRCVKQCDVFYERLCHADQ